ncbi:MAG: aspartate aminotransferase family protein [Candidatus Bathyarchaeia archaeon]|nr:aspartate aminotransferase family protein [Candidatus Bathyarchaeota archaeon]
MNKDEIIAAENLFLANVYQKYPVCIVRGSGAILYDIDGREYIDCMGGYGVSLVGHCHPKIVSAIKEQCERLIACHGSLYNDKRAELLEKLVEIAPRGLSKVFLCNSGAEAVECAIKVAVKYTGKSEIISMVRGFHGKTIGALSATWSQKYRDPFKSLLNPNFKFVPFGRLDKVEEALTENVAAIIVEPIQGEGGVYVAPNGFLEGLRKICDEKNIVLIFDEVQTGFGRTGKMWASEHWGVTPDIMCIGKAMGGGLPIGATLAREDVMNVLKVGEHTSTFGGNPLACAAASAVIDVIIEERLVERAWNLGNKFKTMLQRLVEESRILREVRGLGLMLGLETRVDIYDILMKALGKGVILLYSGRNVIRFLPPLVIELEQIERVIQVLREVLLEEKKKLLISNSGCR